MATAEKLAYTLQAKQAIKQAINDKGVTLGDEVVFGEYGDYILQIQGGGGGGSMAPEIVTLETSGWVAAEEGYVYEYAIQGITDKDILNVAFYNEGDATYPQMKAYDTLITSIFSEEGKVKIYASAIPEVDFSIAIYGIGGGGTGGSGTPIPVVTKEEYGKMTLKDKQEKKLFAVTDENTITLKDFSRIDSYQTMATVDRNTVTQIDSDYFSYRSNWADGAFLNILKTGTYQIYMTSTTGRNVFASLYESDGQTEVKKVNVSAPRDTKTLIAEWDLTKEQILQIGIYNTSSLGDVFTIETNIGEGIQITEIPIGGRSGGASIKVMTTTEFNATPDDKKTSLGIVGICDKGYKITDLLDTSKWVPD